MRPDGKLLIKWQFEHLAVTIDEETKMIAS